MLHSGFRILVICPDIHVYLYIYIHIIISPVYIYIHIPLSLSLFVEFPLVSHWGRIPMLRSEYLSFLLGHVFFWVKFGTLWDTFFLLRGGGGNFGWKNPKIFIQDPHQIHQLQSPIFLPRPYPHLPDPCGRLLALPRLAKWCGHLWSVEVVLWFCPSVTWAVLVGNMMTPRFLEGKFIRF